MSVITFDTLKFVERLRASGIPETQAKAEAEALSSAMGEAVSGFLASKDDVNRIERKMVEFEGEFKSIKWMLGIIVGGVVMLLLRAFFH
jgi:hypothetical protein